MTSILIIRRYLMIAVVSLLVLLALKVTVMSIRESYYTKYQIPNLQLLPNYKYIVSVSKKIPLDARVILVPNKKGMSTGFFFFEAYYLLPRKIYMYKSNLSYALKDVPKSFLKKYKIDWVIYDSGEKLKAKPLKKGR